MSTKGLVTADLVFSFYRQINWSLMQNFSGMGADRGQGQDSRELLSPQARRGSGSWLVGAHKAWSPGEALAMVQPLSHRLLLWRPPVADQVGCRIRPPWPDLELPPQGKIL